MSFSRGPNPIWFMSNLTGQPLDDTYWAFFLTNDLPYVPQAVYQNPDGVEWASPMEFQPSSGLPNNLYFDDDKTYRIEVRRGNTQVDPLIWLVENYTTGIGQEDADTFKFSENLITNPQFSDVFFDEEITFDTAGTYNIAPGWDLVLVGSGTTTITQATNDGLGYVTANAPFSPYYLRFDNSGWTEATLQQTFHKNGAIFSDGSVAVAFTAAVEGGSHTVVVSYDPSTGTPTTIMTPLIATGVLTQVGAYVLTGTSANTDVGEDSFVILKFALPATGIISMTNISFTGQSTPAPADLPAPIYEELTYERIVDHEFNVYRNSLLRQSKGNLLTGWTFALNPFQFNVATTTVAASQTQYICDQTIIHQETASAFSVEKAGGGANFGLQLNSQAAVANNKFALIQYIDYKTVMPYFGQKLSALVKVALFAGAGHTTNVKLKARLIYRSGSAAIPAISATEPISGWDGNGNLLFAAGWTAVAPKNDVAYTLEAPNGNEFPELAFDEFILPSAPNSTPYLGLVLYTTGVINSAAPSDVIVFDRVSLTDNDFAIDALEETYDESLRKCQFYYEKSYNDGITIGVAATEGQYYYGYPTVTNAANTTGFKKKISLRYKQVKRTKSTIRHLYSLAGTFDNVTVGIVNYQNVALIAPTDCPTSQWTLEAESDQGVLFRTNNTTTPIGSSGVAGELSYESYQTFQYTIDARLGV